MWYYGRKEQESPKPFDSRPSGAYVFRPNGTDAQPIANEATLTVQTGNSASNMEWDTNPIFSEFYFSTPCMYWLVLAWLVLSQCITVAVHLQGW